MVDFINKAKGSGMRMIDIVCQAGTQRFRAILLTSLTTFFGIFPLYFENIGISQKYKGKIRNNKIAYLTPK